ncbi:MAG: M23 family metallopeptidase, partial [Syntrophales bacterium]|nr:M23 family metallopeptidase [Syntrophales bacterium]
ERTPRVKKEREKVTPPLVKKVPVSQPLWKATTTQKEANIQESPAASNETGLMPASNMNDAVLSEKGRFSWPVRGKVSNRFGRQPNGMYYNHIRIVTREGAPVSAAGPGMVIFSAPLKEFGETVIVKHDQRFATVYTHLGSRVVQVDHRVRKGEQIGLVGKAEEKNEGYIHFEIRDHNKSRNPLLFLP